MRAAPTLTLRTRVSPRPLGSVPAYPLPSFEGCYDSPRALAREGPLYSPAHGRQVMVGRGSRKAQTPVYIHLTELVEGANCSNLSDFLL